MDDERNEERRSSAENSTPADSYNPYAVDVPLETAAEPRRKLSTIEVVGGVILGLIAGGIAFGVTCTGLTLLTIDLVQNLSGYGFFFVTLILTMSIAIAGSVFYRVFRATTQGKRSAGKIRSDDPANDARRL